MLPHPYTNHHRVTSPPTSDLVLVVRLVDPPEYCPSSSRRLLHVGTRDLIAPAPPAYRRHHKALMQRLPKGVALFTFVGGYRVKSVPTIAIDGVQTMLSHLIYLELVLNFRCHSSHLDCNPLLRDSHALLALFEQRRNR
jgi:hypothetical protein